MAATLRFLALINQNPTDYVEISRQLYEEQELDKIFARAKAKLAGLVHQSQNPRIVAR